MSGLLDLAQRDQALVSLAAINITETIELIMESEDPAVRLEVFKASQLLLLEELKAYRETLQDRGWVIRSFENQAGVKSE